jgi:hypothetical protein
MTILAKSTDTVNSLSAQLDAVIDGIVGPGFDHRDVEYLASHFSVSQLRREIHGAELRHSIVSALAIEHHFPFPFAEFAKACRLALKLKLAATPRPAPRRGRGGAPLPSISEVKARLDIVNVVGQYTTLRKAGRNYLGLCPLHDDRHPSLTVYPDRQSWHCFGCNRGGDVLDFIMAAEGLDFKQALDRLAGGVP